MRMLAACTALAAGLGACTETSAAPDAAASAAPAAREIVEVEALPQGCALTVRFGSYAMGIDRGAAQRIEALLTTDPRVSAVSRHGRGREGEYALCAETRAAADADALLADIRPLLPAKPRGPIEIKLADGTRLHAPPRR